MSNVVLFLGAGASVPLGFPATKEFMAEAQKKNYGATYDQVLHVCKTKYGNTIDIEQVLWELMDFNSWFSKLEGPTSYKKFLMLESNTVGNNVLLRDKGFQVGKLISDVNTLVYDIYWKDGGNSRELYRPLMAEINRTVKSTGLDIFTTNYDLCVEDAFSSSEKLGGNLFTDGFKFDGTNVTWSMKNYDNQDVKLYKLHGSINWKRERKNNGGIWKVAQHDFTGHADQCMIYPGFKEKPDNQPFDWLHSQLGESLRKAEHCITIGFSFRDNHINTLFQEALDRNHLLKILIWNPEMPAHPFKPDRVIHWKEKFGVLNKGTIKQIQDLINPHPHV